MKEFLEGLWSAIKVFTFITVLAWGVGRCVAP